MSVLLHFVFLSLFISVSTTWVIHLLSSGLPSSLWAFDVLCWVQFFFVFSRRSWLELMEGRDATQPHKIPLQLAESWRSNWDPRSVFIFLPVSVNISEAGGSFSNLGVWNTQPSDGTPENSTQMESRGSVRLAERATNFLISAENVQSESFGEKTFRSCWNTKKWHEVIEEAAGTVRWFRVQEASVWISALLSVPRSQDLIHVIAQIRYRRTTWCQNLMSTY